MPATKTPSRSAKRRMFSSMSVRWVENISGKNDSDDTKRLRKIHGSTMRRYRAHSPHYLPKINDSRLSANTKPITKTGRKTATLPVINLFMSCFIDRRLRYFSEKFL